MNHNDHSNLQPLDQGIARAARFPQWLMAVAGGAIVVIAWAWLSVQSAGVMAFSTEELGPGMRILEPALGWIAERAKTSPFFESLLYLCTPQSLSSDLATFATLFSMWLAMSVAMMLPSAAPMLRTYADIAHVARERGETTVSLSVLAGGYIFIWGVFALAIAALQMAIMIGLNAGAAAPLVGWIGGFILLGAGLYQFSALKDACLEKCRNPFNTLFASWRTDRSGVFKLGIEQGVFCIGCCWAIMLVMFVVGTMNLVWMAFFTLFAIVEKSGRGNVTSLVSGCILMFWGGALLVLAALTDLGVTI
ncbi:DUF2182 domain-containing protein [Pseudahrensia aquimaris]|uniref:DUF2182 domain-containing protein n=1 Tax=Pseudahrensia aquimaris TaxID=744461 RepID=A0ABW3FMM2_9HYPH